MKVICTKGMWCNRKGEERTYPWLSGHGAVNFFKRNYRKPLFNDFARCCGYFDDMRPEDQVDGDKNCCDCYNCRRVK